MLRQTADTGINQSGLHIQQILDHDAALCGTKLTALGNHLIGKGRNIFFHWIQQVNLTILQQEHDSGSGDGLCQGVQMTDGMPFHTDSLLDVRKACLVVTLFLTVLINQAVDTSDIIFCNHSIKNILYFIQTLLIHKKPSPFAEQNSCNSVIYRLCIQVMASV